MNSLLAGTIRKLVPETLRPIGYLTHLARNRTGMTVRQGPFQGMQYISSSVGSAYIPKLLGIYERELNGCVESLVRMNPKRVVDVGAAEGYYAVGLARRIPDANVVGFEMERRGRDALAEMAKRNHVAGRVTINGRCEPEDLARALEPNPRDCVVVCDVEGYEEALLDPVAVPALTQTAILVELHDFIVDGITETLKQRFSKTHSIEHLWQEPRSRDEFPWTTIGTRILPTQYLDWSVSEWRPVRMAWLWMTPKEIA